MWINTAILRTSKAIHDEAENFLYQLHEFDFTHDVSRVVPFLQSLSDEARQNVSRLTVHLINAYVISVGPPGQPRLGGSAIVRANTPDWGQACSYIAHNVRLRELAFRLESEVSEDFQSLPWVQNMVQIKGLRMLTYYERYWQGQREHWRISDEDRSTTDTSDRNQALLSYLRSHMLKVPTKRC